MSIAPYSPASRWSALADIFHLGGSAIKETPSESHLALPLICSTDGVYIPHMEFILSLQIDELLQQGIGYRYNTAIGLEASLSGNHGCELGRQIHIRHFQLAGGHIAVS